VPGMTHFYSTNPSNTFSTFVLSQFGKSIAH
jgi:hypothetical protein